MIPNGIAAWDHGGGLIGYRLMYFRFRGDFGGCERGAKITKALRRLMRGERAAIPGQPLPGGGIPTKRHGRIAIIIKARQPMPWPRIVGRLTGTGGVGPGSHDYSPCCLPESFPICRKDAIIFRRQASSSSVRLWDEKGAIIRDPRVFKPSGTLGFRMLQ
jgi:hypothetical protein